MRKSLNLILLIFVLWQPGCSKKNNNGCGFQNTNIVAPLSEQQAVKAYTDSIGEEVIMDPSGFYYRIVTEGIGATPGVCSQITVSYKGELMNDQVFDQQSGYLYTLGSLIEGWKKGLPLIKAGGEIKLYIPPTLGYGSKAVPTNTFTIPPNSILIFDIHLLDVQ